MAGPPPLDSKDARLAEALRANLRRRKAAQAHPPELQPPASEPASEDVGGDGAGEG